MADYSEKPSEQQLTTRGLDITATDSHWGFKGHNYLFIIGIDKYKCWHSLNCAVKDVQDFVKVLTERYQFEQAFVHTLLDEKATMQNIFGKFKELAQKVTDQDNLLIYFSGHGHYDEITKTSYWIPVDAQTGYENDYQFINTVVVVDTLRKIKSLHTFLIVDACFSGTILYKGEAKVSPKSERYKSRIVFASGRAEVVMDGQQGENSPFAKGILGILKLNDDKYISASKLILEVKEYVSKEAEQSPTDGRLERADDQGGDFIFCLKMSEAESWASVVQQDSLVAYQKFIERFPDSKHLAEAEEATDWLNVKEKNTKQSLSNYLIKLDKSQVSGNYRPRAIQALYEIEELECWENASTIDTLNAYFEYLSKFKSGNHVEEANVRIEELLKDEDDKAFKKALDEGSSHAIQEYLENPGDKKYQQEAEKKLSAINIQLDETSQEQSAWEIAKNTDNYVAYYNFVQAYPGSPFLDVARQKMKKMDDVAWKEIQFFEYDSSLSSEEKIRRCITYFDNFPGADNNVSVKQMKDQFEFEKYSQKSIGLNLLHLPKNRETGAKVKILTSKVMSNLPYIHVIHASDALEQLDALKEILQKMKAAHRIADFTLLSDIDQLVALQDQVNNNDAVITLLTLKLERLNEIKSIARQLKTLRPEVRIGEIIIDNLQYENKFITFPGDLGPIRGRGDTISVWNGIEKKLENMFPAESIQPTPVETTPVEPTRKKLDWSLNLLTISAVILLIAWALGFFVYSVGGLIHILLVIAIIAVIFRLTRGERV